MKKNEQSLRRAWDSTRWSNIRVTEILKGDCNENWSGIRKRRLSTEELMLMNFGAGDDS